MLIIKQHQEDFICDSLVEEANNQNNNQGNLSFIADEQSKDLKENNNNVRHITHVQKDFNEVNNCYLNTDPGNDLDLETYREEDFYENNKNYLEDDDYESNLNCSNGFEMNATFPVDRPLRRAFSCASCAMADTKSPIKRTQSGGFPIRRVASCNVCCWEFDERSEQSFATLNTTASSSSDEIENSSSKNSLRRSHSYSSALNLGICVDSDNNQADENVEPNESASDEGCSRISDVEIDVDSQSPNLLKRSDSYSTGINDVGQVFTNSASFDKEDFEQPNSPTKDSTSGSTKSSPARSAKKRRSFIDKALRRNKQRTPPDGGECEPSETYFTQESVTPTISVSATKELDEIFGKINKTPQTSLDEECDNYSESSFDRTQKEVLRSSRRYFKRLSPKRMLLEKVRSRSVEHLNIAAPALSSNLTRSSLEISTVMDYNMTYDSADISEKWNSFLKRIGGQKLYANNQTLRYLWEQMNTNQVELCQPFEDFLKSGVEEVQQMHNKCQETEQLVTIKLEVQEKERLKVYEDVENVIQQERKLAEKQLHDRGEELRREHKNMLDARDNDLQQVLRDNTHLTQQLHTNNTNIETFKSTINLMDHQINELIITEEEVKRENKRLNEERLVMVKKLNEYDASIKELQQHILACSKELQVEKEKSKSCLRQYKDILEEKQFLDANVHTLSTEVSELKNVNMRLRDMKSFNDSESDISIGEDMKMSAEYQNHESRSIFSRSEKKVRKLHRSFRLKINKPKPDGEPDAINSPLVIKKTINAQEWPLSPPKNKQANSSSESLQSTPPKQQPFYDSLNSTAPTSPVNETFHFNSPQHTSQHQFNPSQRTPQLAASFHTDSLDSTPSTAKKALFTPPSVKRNIHSFSTPQSQLSTINTPSLTPIRLASQFKQAFKIIFIGDSNVGKTSFIRRVCYGKFRARREQTMEMDYSTIEVDYKGKKVALNLWDTLGQERFNSIPPSYFRRSDVVVLMYDIMEEQSFVNVRNWIRTIHDFTDENVFLVIAGNKLDLYHKKIVSSERAKSLAKDHDAMFVETSAKTGENITKFCDMIISTLLDRDDTVLIRKDFTSSLCNLSYQKRQTSITKCCN